MRQATTDGYAVVTDDWKRLGDVVRGIVERTEGLMIERPPVPTADADLFHRLLLELYGSAMPSAVQRKDGQEQ